MAHITHLPRLHALIGDAAQHLSSENAQRLERALQDNPPTPSLAAAQHLHALRTGCCADGTPWTELQLPPERALQMARASRCLHAAGVLLQVLHAAHSSGEDDSVAPWLDAYAVDGIFHASRELLECADGALQQRH